MGFSSLANMSRRIDPGGRYSYRSGGITGVILHYNYGVDSYSEAWNPSREVSANYWGANSGDLLPHIDEAYRAWTSGAYGYPNGALADDCSITFELSNRPGFLTSTPMGAISDALYAKTVAAIGEIFYRYGLGPVRRTTSPTAVGVRVHNDFVPTSCPGPWLLSWLPHLIASAENVRRALAGEAPLQPIRRNNAMQIQTIVGRPEWWLIMDNGTWVHLQTPAEAKAAQWIIDNNVKDCSTSDNEVLTGLWKRMQAAYFKPVTDAIAALGKPTSIDPAAVTKTVDAATKQALAGLEITLRSK